MSNRVTESDGRLGWLGDRLGAWCLWGWAGVACLLLIMLGFGGSALSGIGAGSLFAAYAALALVARRRPWWMVVLVIGWGLAYPHWRNGVLDLVGFIGDLCITNEEPDNPVLRVLWGRATGLLACGLCGVGTAVVIWIATRSRAVAAWTLAVSLAIEPWVAGRSDVSITPSGIVVTDKTYGPFKTTVDSVAFAVWHVVVSGAVFRWAGRWRWPRRVRAWRCDGCGYDMRGLPGRVCPECGKGAAIVDARH